MTEPRPPEETTIEDLGATPTTGAPTPNQLSGQVPVSATPAGTSGSGRAPLRWVLAIAGIVVVLAATAIIVSLAGARPPSSVALGYMPASMYSYTEARFDLPGDQQQKLAAFLHNGEFPGFADQAQINPKVEDVYDRIVRWVTEGKQTYTGNIQPWFGGQIGIGQGLPSSLGALAGGPLAKGPNQPILIVATVTNRAKALDWVSSTGDVASLNRTTYSGADLFQNADRPGFVLAVTDKVLLAGSEGDVKAAVDSGGNGALGQDPDIKAALATVDRDYAVMSVTRTKAYLGGLAKLIASASPGTLEGTQIDETLLAMIPPWTATIGRFEDDALVTTSTGPAWDIGYEAKNEPSDLLGHVPANTVAYVDTHDVGPSLTAVIARFRALPETKPFFDQFDQTLSIIGGFDSVFGWWGDTAFVVAPSQDGTTIGGGLVIKPRDAAAADRLLTTIRGFVAIGGANSGMTVRDEDHNGTKITILDFSAMSGIDSAGLPPGYKAEFAWATNADVTVLGYGRDFVASVLDAGPGHSLADDARFKALLDRVGAENITASFVDLAAIRRLIEQLAQSAIPADKWAFYEKEVQPYLAPFDAIVQATRKDGSVDHSTGALTVH